jgi:transposase, IS30 family
MKHTPHNDERNTRSYTHITKEERLEINILRDKGYGIREIACVLGRNHTSISREVRKNQVREVYDAKRAHHKAYVRRKYARYQGKTITEDIHLQQYIIERLAIGWSPDEIAGRMKRDGEPFSASKTTIYEWLRTVWGEPYCRYLYSKRRRVRKQRQHTQRTLIPRRVGLERRPAGATNRTRYGHWEGDTMVSGRKTGSTHALSVIYERKARYIEAEKIPNLKPASHGAAVRGMTQDKNTKSLTFDNGIENRDHETLGVPTFFCDPYSSWQKGGVEHAIKMIRRYIPKRVDIGLYPSWYISMVIRRLNHTPRKSLGYKTPYEVMTHHHQFVGNKNTPGGALRG